MSWDIGDTVPLVVRIMDGGVLVDPDGLSCTLLRPDGSSAPADFVQTGTGTFAAEVVPDSAGDWGVVWQSVGPSTAYRDTFSVTDTAAVLPMGLAEVKRWLRIEGEASDEPLRGLIDEVCAIGETYTGCVFGRRTITHVTRSAGTSSVLLPLLPVLSVQSVTIDGVADEGWAWDSQAGVLHWSYMLTRGAEVRVVYVGGYATQPRAHITGARALLRHIWRESRGAVRPGAPVDEWLPFGVGYYVADFWGLGRVSGFA